MPVTQTLRPFRDYDEKDVINLYAYSGAVIDSNYMILATKGTLVAITGNGYMGNQEPDQMLGNMGYFTTNNWVGQRYGVIPQCTAASAGQGVVPVGMLLFDVREWDENQLWLKYNPRKAAEMEAVISGQAVPMVTRGIFLYSGIQVINNIPVTPGARCYLGYSGGIGTSGVGGATELPVGKFLGATGAPFTTGNSYGDYSSIALIWLNIQ